MKNFANGYHLTLVYLGKVAWISVHDVVVTLKGIGRPIHFDD